MTLLFQSLIKKNPKNQANTKKATEDPPKKKQRL